MVGLVCYDKNGVETFNSNKITTSKYINIRTLTTSSGSFSDPELAKYPNFFVQSLSGVEANNNVYLREYSYSNGVVSYVTRSGYGVKEDIMYGGF